MNIMLLMLIIVVVISTSLEMIVSEVSTATAEIAWASFIVVTSEASAPASSLRRGSSQS